MPPTISRAELEQEHAELLKDHRTHLDNAAKHRQAAEQAQANAHAVYGALQMANKLMAKLDAAKTADPEGKPA